MEQSDMGWLAFVASVVDSLAWPAVIIVLLLLLRPQLAGLAERIEEFSLPGGAQAKFATKLKSAKEEAQVLLTTEQVAAPEVSAHIIELAKTSPEGAVMKSFEELETVVFDVQARLSRAFPTLPRQAGASTVRRLLQMGLIDEAAANLYRNLREARNSAAHARTRISETEALEYAKQVRTMTQVFLRVLEELPE